MSTLWELYPKNSIGIKNNRINSKKVKIPNACVKPVKGHSKDPEKVPFIFRLILYSPLINGENGASLYRQWFVIQKCL